MLGTLGMGERRVTSNLVAYAACLECLSGILPSDMLFGQELKSSHCTRPAVAYLCAAMSVSPSLVCLRTSVHPMGMLSTTTATQFRNTRAGATLQHPESPGL
jgi:hypothetical protein